MDSVSNRIEQFRKMAEADPQNELGHFSLGRAYLDAQRCVEAAESFRRAISLNANLSKAYQLLAQALLAQDQRQAAIEQLQAGVKVADARGDLMPRNEMIAMLRDLGAVLPEMKSSAGGAGAVGPDQVSCSRCGRAGRKMASPPFRNEQGKMLHEKVCADCWQEWIRMGTKVINELRLPLSDPAAQKIFDQHMLEFLNLK
jgi:Fe-S cluster biosynthesis and repair protein YggX